MTIEEATIKINEMFFPAAQEGNVVVQFEEQYRFIYRNGKWEYYPES